MVIINKKKQLLNAQDFEIAQDKIILYWRALSESHI